MKQSNKKYFPKAFLIIAFISNSFLSTSLYATVFTVDSTLDLHDAVPGDGICKSAAPELKCTLRAALDEANNSPDADIINLPPGEYIQQSPLVGDRFKISNSLEIIGADPATTIINANAVGSVFYLRQTATSSTITLSNIQMKNADFSGIDASAITNINLNNVVITNSRIGIYILPPQTGNSAVTISNSIIENNHPKGNPPAGGGGVVFISTVPLAKLIFKDSTIRNNSSQNGGGIFISGEGITTLISNTVTNNLATTSGGGIYAVSNATLNIVNSTISGNLSNGSGGGIKLTVASKLSLFNTTITDNHADMDVDGSGYGGGLSNFGTTGAITAINSLIAGNVDHNPQSLLSSPDCYITIPISQGNNTQLNLIGHNIIGDRTNCYINDGVDNIIGTATNVIDPILGALADNGGTTKTHALLSGSPAIDTGNPNGCMDEGGTNLLATDQRGLARHSDGGIGSARCDIGSFEVINTNPIANAGSDQIVTVGATVTLDGSASNGIAGNITNYDWFQLTNFNPTVTLNDPTLVKTTFTAPTVASILLFELTVTDELGQQSAPSKIKITVNAASSGGGSSGGGNTNNGTSPPAGGSSGGCSINQTAIFDPLFFLLFIISLLSLSRRKTLNR